MHSKAVAKCTNLNALHTLRVNEAAQVHTEFVICCKFEDDDDTKQGPLLSHDWVCSLFIVNHNMVTW